MKKRLRKKNACPRRYVYILVVSCGDLDSPAVSVYTDEAALYRDLNCLKGRYEEHGAYIRGEFDTSAIPNDRGFPAAYYRIEHVRVNNSITNHPLISSWMTENELEQSGVRRSSSSSDDNIWEW